MLQEQMEVELPILSADRQTDGHFVGSQVCPFQRQMGSEWGVGLEKEEKDLESEIQGCSGDGG